MKVNVLPVQRGRQVSTRLQWRVPLLSSLVRQWVVVRGYVALREAQLEGQQSVPSQVILEKAQPQVQ
jgi:hypothetical protein